MANYIDFDDKAKTRNTLIKWICLEIILLVCYQAYPLVGKFSKNRIFNDIFLIAFLLIFTMVAEHFSLTFKVFNEQIKTRGAVKVITIIFFVFLTLFALINAVINDIKIFKLSMHRTLAIILIALAAAICEEILFLGILFNICLVVIRKNKYNLLWTSILTSIFFGLMHLINLVHQPLVATSGQIIFAMALGLVFSYLRIR